MCERGERKKKKCSLFSSFPFLLLIQLRRCLAATAPPPPPPLQQANEGKRVFTAFAAAAEEEEEEGRVSLHTHTLSFPHKASQFFAGGGP